MPDNGPLDLSKPRITIVVSRSACLRALCIRIENVINRKWREKNERSISQGLMAAPGFLAHTPSGSSSSRLFGCCCCCCCCCALSLSRARASRSSAAGASHAAPHSLVYYMRVRAAGAQSTFSVYRYAVYVCPLSLYLTRELEKSESPPRAVSLDNNIALSARAILRGFLSVASVGELIGR